jgi:hypothetical protein
MSMKMFGHAVEIRKSTDGQEQLLVDKKILLKDQYISLDEIATVDGTPSVIGQRSAGGNACNGSAFILSFPTNAAVKIDGPLDSCNPNETTVEEKQITVRVAPTPQTPGSQWIWSPSSGFSAEKSIAFAAKQDDGWTALRSRSIDHPSGLLDYADLTRLIDARIGKAKASFISVSSGPGSAQYRNNLLIATSCRAHSCDDTSLLVVVDIAARQVFVALKDGAASLIIAPQSAGWPSGARFELVAFQQKWRR